MLGMSWKGGGGGTKDNKKIMKILPVPNKKKNCFEKVTENW
jgi:hypothetical protein